MRTLIQIVLVIVLVVGLAACGPRITRSSPNHVIVQSYQMNADQAQRMADTECGKFRRRATLVLEPSTRDDERDYIFACVD